MAVEMFGCSRVLCIFFLNLLNELFVYEKRDDERNTTATDIGLVHKLPGHQSKQ